MSVSPTLPRGLNDQSLLRRYTEAGSEAAFSELVTRHGRMVYGVCRRELKDAQLAEDAAQVAFLLLARNAGSLSSTSHIAGWLFKAALFSAKNIARAERTRKAREERAGHDMLRSQGHDGQSKATWDALEPELNAALAALKPADREVILLRYVEGRTWAEIGSAQGLSDDTAQKRSSRALQILRRRLGPACGAIPVAMLASLLTENAAQSAPEDLEATLISARTGIGASSLHHIAQGVSLMMGVQKFVPLIAATGIVLLTATAFGAFRPHNPIASIRAVATGDPTAQALMKSIQEHYAGYSAFSMDIEQHDSSGLYPGNFTQHLDWKRGGVFTLAATSQPGKPVPDFTGDGAQVTQKFPDGTTNTDPEIPAPNTSPGWEVTSGFIMSWLQNTATGQIFSQPPAGIQTDIAMGERTRWHGLKVRELKVTVTQAGYNGHSSMFVDPATHAYVGYEWHLDRDGKGGVGYALYKNQKGS